MKSKPAICVIRRRRLVHLSPIFKVNEQTCLIDYTIANEVIEPRCQKLATSSKLTELLSRNRDSNTIPIEHVYAICCRPEAADDVISGEDVDTVPELRLCTFIDCYL